MECGNFTQLLSARLDGALTAEEEQRLEQHLAQCPACRALSSQLAATQDFFDALDDIPAPEGFARRVMERIRAQEAPEKAKISRLRRPYARALAGLAACLLLCVGVYRAGVPGTERDAADDEPAALYTVGGAETTDSVPEASDSDGSLMGRAGGAPQAYAEDAEPALSACGAEPREEVRYDAAAKQAYQLAGQSVSAVLTLPQLPEGAKNVLGTDAEWSTDEDGSPFCIVTGSQMEALMTLADEQWPDRELVEIASSRIEAEDLCAVVLEEP